jgi:hypothetical protein
MAASLLGSARGEAGTGDAGVTPGAEMPESSAHVPTVMPTQVGIHAFAACSNGKSWMPTFVGMTVATWADESATPPPGIIAAWYN